VAHGLRAVVGSVLTCPRGPSMMKTRSFLEEDMVKSGVTHSSPFTLTRHSVLSTSARLCDCATLRRGEEWREREGEGAMMCVNPTQATTVVSGARYHST
jgi:hypothetical protein